MIEHHDVYLQHTVAPVATSQDLCFTIAEVRLHQL